MAKPYESNYRVTTTGTNEVVELMFPGRIDITRISIVRVGNGAIGATLYSRKFTSATVPISQILDNGSGKMRIFLWPARELPVSINDTITIADTTVAGYHTTHLVTATETVDLDSVISDFYIDTATTFTAAARGGTAQLTVPVAEQPIYQVMGKITGTDSVLELPPDTGSTVTYINRDPVSRKFNIGVNRRIYVKLDAIATYVIALGGHSYHH